MPDRPFADDVTLTGIDGQLRRPPHAAQPHEQAPRFVGRYRSVLVSRDDQQRRADTIDAVIGRVADVTLRISPGAVAHASLTLLRPANPVTVALLVQSALDAPQIIRALDRDDGPERMGLAANRGGAVAPGGLVAEN